MNRLRLTQRFSTPLKDMQDFMQMKQLARSTISPSSSTFAFLFTITMKGTIKKYESDKKDKDQKKRQLMSSVYSKGSTQRSSLSTCAIYFVKRHATKSRNEVLRMIGRERRKEQKNKRRRKNEKGSIKAKKMNWSIECEVPPLLVTTTHHEYGLRSESYLHEDRRETN